MTDRPSPANVRHALLEPPRKQGPTVVVFPALRKAEGVLCGKGVDARVTRGHRMIDAVGEFEIMHDQQLAGARRAKDERRV